MLMDVIWVLTDGMMHWQNINAFMFSSCFLLRGHKHQTEKQERNYTPNWEEKDERVREGWE